MKGVAEINLKFVSVVTSPDPDADNSKFAFDADDVIMLSVMLMALSMFKVPVTVAPVCVTLNLSAKEAPSYVLKKIVFDVPDVPSI